MRHIPRVLAALAALLLPSAALAGKATTTRIETRPFYGATVTLEAGVRVFRPLPYHDRVIINPGGKTPLTLGFEQNHTYNHGGGERAERGRHDPETGVVGSGAPIGFVQGAGVGAPETAAKRFVPRHIAAPVARFKPHGPAKP